MNYLLKTEPSEYSFADLRRDGETTWDGVSNPVALKHVRAMKSGDRLIIYETGDVKSAVGTATGGGFAAMLAASRRAEKQSSFSSGKEDSRR